MSIITLTTDWNKDDYYIGAVKGSIYNNCTGVTIVDISHQVKPFNIYQAAFILKNVYKYYPKGSVHIIGVKTEAFGNQNYLASRPESLCSSGPSDSTVAPGPAGPASSSTSGAAWFPTTCWPWHASGCLDLNC